MRCAQQLRIYTPKQKHTHKKSKLNQTYNQCIKFIIIYLKNQLIHVSQYQLDSFHFKYNNVE